jgi:hypothetical protein
LDQLLLKFANLRQLSIDAVNRQISISDKNIVQNKGYPTLKKLDLYGLLDNTLIGYIERSLPNVVELPWRNNNPPVQTNNFVLPNHTFTMLDINLPPQMEYMDDDSSTVIYNIRWQNAEDVSIRLAQFDSVYGYEKKRMKKRMNVAPEINGQALIINITRTGICQLYCGEVIIF